MKLFGMLIFVSVFAQCVSVKPNMTTPFIIQKTAYSSINTGLLGNRNLNLMIEFTADKTVDFKKIYFQHQIMNAIIEQKNGKKYIIAHSKLSINQDRKDFVLNTDPQKEYGNTIPFVNKKFPFKLKENQAVITYKIGDKIHTYKIENISKEKKIFIPL